MGGVTLRTVDLARARLHAGGTYFRARNTGTEGNNISLVLEEYGTDDAALVVINRNLKADEMVTGPAVIEIFDLHLQWNQSITIHNPTTNPSARSNSISAQIAHAEVPYVDLGPVRLDRIFGVPGMLAVRVTLKAAGQSPDEVITIALRRRVHRLKRLEGTHPGQWDIEALREEVNATNPWIQMPERGSDVRDLETDGELTPFGEVFLVGGTGLPARPDLEAPLIGGAIIHANYGEAEDGSLTEHNRIYQWVGTARGGSWA